MNWLQQLIRAELIRRGDLEFEEAKHGALELLAKDWGVAAPTLRKWWRDGALPHSSTLPRLFKAIGGDFSRALPYRNNADEVNRATATTRQENERLGKEVATLKTRVSELEGTLRRIRAAVDQSVPNMAPKRPPSPYRRPSPEALILNDGGESPKED